MVGWWPDRGNDDRIFKQCDQVGGRGFYRLAHKQKVFYLTLQWAKRTESESRAWRYLPSTNANSKKESGKWNIGIWDEPD